MSEDHFDAKAATWDEDPAKHQRAQQVAAAIIEQVGLSPTSPGSRQTAPHLLEVGAGTGLVAGALRDHVGAVTLADTSRGMIEVMRAKAGDPDHALFGANVLHEDLLAGPSVQDDAAPRDQSPAYDLVVAVLVLHHVDDPATGIGLLADRLAPGGVVAVVDLDSEDGSFHDREFDGHHGFDRFAITGWFRQAKLDDVAVSTAGSITNERGTFSMLLATGRRR